MKASLSMHRRRGQHPQERANHVAMREAKLYQNSLCHPDPEGWWQVYGEVFNQALTEFATSITTAESCQVQPSTQGEQ